MNDYLMYLLMRYTVQITITSENSGTSRDIRYYTATASMQNSSSHFTAHGFAHGTMSDDTRQEAIQAALHKLVKVAKAIEETY